MTALAVPEGGADEKPSSLGREALKRLRRNPSAIVGASLVAMFVLTALFAPWLAPYAPKKRIGFNLIRPNYVPGPSAHHWFGLDLQGRDELSRIIYGARYSLLIGVCSLLFGAAFGMLFGLLAGAFGGWVDSLMMRITDIMLAIPGLLFAIGLAAVLGPSLTSVMVSIGVVNVPLFARLLRGSMLAYRDSDFVLAATATGITRRRVVLAHVLPNSLGPMIVQGTLALATAIIDAAGLAFLGLGTADPSVPEWGRMLGEMDKALGVAPHLLIFPGAAILLSALGFNLLGEAMREALDPKLRR